MAERPILFSAPMVRAILAGTKTQTRRIVRGVPSDELVSAFGTEWVYRSDPETLKKVRCPYGVAGDRLWVRETWAPAGCTRCDELPPEAQSARECTCKTAVYRADDGARAVTWRPSIYMPRWASRIALEVVSVRAERLHAITEDDAHAEGVIALDGSLDEAALCVRAKTLGGCAEDARTWFAELWDRINGDRAAWASNPWVWVVSFKRAEVRRG